jgi:hypothetical protein
MLTGGEEIRRLPTGDERGKEISNIRRRSEGAFDQQIELQVASYALSTICDRHWDLALHAHLLRQ